MSHRARPVVLLRLRHRQVQLLACHAESRCPGTAARAPHLCLPVPQLIQDAVPPPGLGRTNSQIQTLSSLPTRAGGGKALPRKPAVPPSRTVSSSDMVAPDASPQTRAKVSMVTQRGHSTNPRRLCSGRGAPGRSLRCASHSREQQDRRRSVISQQVPGGQRMEGAGCEEPEEGWSQATGRPRGCPGRQVGRPGSGNDLGAASLRLAGLREGGAAPRQERLLVPEGGGLHPPQVGLRPSACCRNDKPKHDRSQV